MRGSKGAEPRQGRRRRTEGKAAGTDSYGAHTERVLAQLEADRKAPRYKVRRGRAFAFLAVLGLVPAIGAGAWFGVQEETVSFKTDPLFVVETMPENAVKYGFDVTLTAPAWQIWTRRALEAAGEAKPLETRLEAFGQKHFDLVTSGEASSQALAGKVDPDGLQQGWRNVSLTPYGDGAIVTSRVRCMSLPDSKAAAQAKLPVPACN